MFESQIWTLGERELPGMGCWNSMARFLRGFQSRNKYLSLNTRPGGGCYFEIDVESIAEFVKQYLESIEEEETDPTKTSRRAIIPARTVFLYDTKIAVSSATIQVGLGRKCVWLEIRRSTANYRSGDNFPALANLSEKHLNWPICTLELRKIPLDKDEKESLKPAYYIYRDDRHVGDICIPTLPHFWLKGYGDEFAVRSAENGDEFYYKPEKCEEEEENT